MTKISGAEFTKQLFAALEAFRRAHGVAAEASADHEALVSRALTDDERKEARRLSARMRLHGLHSAPWALPDDAVAVLLSADDMLFDAARLRAEMVFWSSRLRVLDRHRRLTHIRLVEEGCIVEGYASLSYRSSGLSFTEILHHREIEEDLASRRAVDRARGQEE